MVIDLLIFELQLLLNRLQKFSICCLRGGNSKGGKLSLWGSKTLLDYLDLQGDNAVGGANL